MHKIKHIFAKFEIGSVKNLTAICKYLLYLYVGFFGSTFI